MFAGARREHATGRATLPPVAPRARPAGRRRPPRPARCCPSRPRFRCRRRSRSAPPPGPLPQAARDRLTDLAGGFALTPLVTAACTAPWAVFQSSVPWSLLGRVFLLSTLLAWAVMIIGRLPKKNEQNPWGRRAIQLVVGLCIGALAFWLDGWALPTGTAQRHQPRPRAVHEPPHQPGHALDRDAVPVLLRADGRAVPVVEGDRLEAEGAGAVLPAAGGRASGAGCSCSCGRASPPR